MGKEASDVKLPTVVDIPSKIINTMLQTAGNKVITERMVSKTEFYTKWFLPQILLVPTLERDILVLHAVFAESLMDQLNGIECIPVSPDGRNLKTIKELIDPRSRIATLFDAEEGRFPMWISDIKKHKYDISSVNDGLRILGMKSEYDDLSWEEVLERCCFVQEHPQYAATRTPIILELAQHKVMKTDNNTEINSSLVNSQIRKTKFLPFMKKPTKFPLKWRGNDFEDGNLISCEESYLPDQMYDACCSHPIVDEQRSFNSSMAELKSFLGLTNKLVTTQTIISQLDEIISFVKKGEEVDCFISIKQAYGKLLHLLNTNIQKDMVSELIIERLKNTDCIMLDQRKCESRKYLMMSPCQCATSSDHKNLLPYLATIPEYKESYPELINILGIKKDFTVSDYISVLKKMDEEFQGEQLDKSHLDMAIAINKLHIQLM